MVCSTEKLNRPMPPKAQCKVPHSLFTFQFIPRKNRHLKISVWRIRRDSARGMARVAIPYRMPAHSLNLYAIHPIRAGRCALRILLTQLTVFPVTFSSICLESTLLIADQTPKDFSVVVTWPLEIGARVPSGRGIVISVSGCGLYLQRPLIHS